MASADGISSSYVGLSLRRLLFSPSSSSGTHAAAADADRNPLIGAPRVPPPSPPRMKRGLAEAAFRGLGCASASASRAYSPAAAAVRSSADWQGRQPRRRPGKKKKDRKCQVGGDLWCSPGIPFAAEVSVDCVAAHQPMVGRGRPEATERINRERAYVPRRVGHEEQISSSKDSPANVDTSFIAPELLRSRPLRHFQGHHRTPDGLEEIMMFQTRVLHDRFRDWRLDVDNMSYEELLELSDKIGHVSTGLRDEEILRSLRKGKDSAFDSEVESQCSICQEEYRMSGETGRLECGHSYHMHCIKQWLLLKNACPVCKTPVLRT